MAESSNFAFLREHDPVFFQLASTAERVFASDPNTTLIKLRQLGEALAQNLVVRAGAARCRTASGSPVAWPSGARASSPRPSAVNLPPKASALL